MQTIFQITGSSSGNCSLFYLDHKKTITWHDLRRGLRRGCYDLPSGFYSSIFCVFYVFFLRITVYDFESEDTQDYTFSSAVKTGIYEDLIIDFSELAGLLDL